MSATLRWTWPILAPAAMGRGGSARGFGRSLMVSFGGFWGRGRRRGRHVGGQGPDIKLRFAIIQDRTAEPSMTPGKGPFPGDTAKMPPKIDSPRAPPP